MIYLNKIRAITLLMVSLCSFHSAHAVHLSSNELGQVLLVPYYNTRGDQDTLFSVSNATGQAKAIKVRVVEGENGRVVQSLNLYLGAFDSWSASITESNAGPGLRVNDASCTVPYHFGQGNLAMLDLTHTGPMSDEGRTSIDRTREGFIEIIEMGTLSAEGLGASTQLNDQGEHQCDALINAWDVNNDNAQWINDAQQDLLPPSGGLYGQAALIDTQGARASSMPVTALARFYTPELNDPPSLHSAPSSAEPSLAAAHPAESQTLLLLDHGPEVIRDRWPNGISAVTAALMAERVQAQHRSRSAIEDATEWVITFPTKPFFTQTTTGALDPFDDTFRVRREGFGAAACDALGMFYFDNDGRIPGLAPAVPSTPFFFSLCNTTNVLAFTDEVRSQGSVMNEANDLSSIALKSRLFRSFTGGFGPEFRRGWTELLFHGNGNLRGSNGGTHTLQNPNSQRTYLGLPVIGFALRWSQDRANNRLFGLGNQYYYTRRIEGLN